MITMIKSSLSIRGNAENIDKWKEEKKYFKTEVCFFFFFFQSLHVVVYGLPVFLLLDI